jgi:hypothetical protein
MANPTVADPIALPWSAPREVARGNRKGNRGQRGVFPSVQLPLAQDTCPRCCPVPVLRSGQVIRRDHVAANDVGRRFLPSPLRWPAGGAIRGAAVA